MHNVIKLRLTYQMNVSVEQSFSHLTAHVDVALYNANQLVLCHHWLLLNIRGCQELADLDF